VSVLQAVRRYPTLVAAPMLALAALGAVIGYARTPTYKAASELAVGQLNVSDPAAVGSVVQATQSLAGVYSRMIDATGVRQRIAKSSVARGSQIDATPIPGSPLIRVVATGHSSGDAAAASNAASQALLEYSKTYGASSDRSSSIYEKYKNASLAVAKAQGRVGGLAQAYGRSHSPADKRALAKAQSDLDAARLRRDGLRFKYGANQQSAQAAPVLRAFSRAGGAWSDRVSFMEILALLGAVAGAGIGCALATTALKRRVAHLMST
jgi:hypothetical protein